MLKSYEITIEGDKVTWLRDKPTTKITQGIFVTDETQENSISIKPQKRSTPEHLRGKVKILGDIVNPIVDEDDWQCLKS